MSYTENGKINYVKSYFEEDHGFWTVTVPIDMDGSVQAFGNLVLDKDLNALFCAKLCFVFGVESISELKDKPCVVHRCFDSWNTPIEALEDPKSKRKFILTDWVRENINSKIETVIEREQKSILSTIEWAERRLNDAKNSLASLNSRYREVK